MKGKVIAASKSPKSCPSADNCPGSEKQAAGTSVVAKLAVVLAYIFSVPLYWFSFLVPRSKRIWVFGAWYGLRYSDNSRYLFEYVQKHTDIKAIWISRGKDVVSLIRANGHSAFLRHSIKGSYYMLRASIAIVSSSLADLNRSLVYRAFKVNLWHGAPMKKLNYGNSTGKTESFVKSFCKKLFASVVPYSREIGVYQAVLATSDYFKPLMAWGFGVQRDNVPILGYPRNDILFAETQRSEFIESLKSIDYANILAYLPTYKETDELGEVFGRFGNYGFDREEMGKFLEETKSILLVKLHFADQTRIKNEGFSLGPRIVYVDEKRVGDINDILRYVDVLITDYSGVYFDYLLLNRPIVFAAFDLEEYLERRGLSDDYEFYVSGPVARNWPEVIRCAREAMLNPNKYEGLRVEKNKVFNKYHDGDSASRVYEYLRQQLMTSI